MTLRNIFEFECFAPNAISSHHRERARRMQERLDEIDNDEKAYKKELKRAIKKEGDLKIF